MQALGLEKDDSETHRSTVGPSQSAPGTYLIGLSFLLSAAKTIPGVSQQERVPDSLGTRFRSDWGAWQSA